jgi:hypothetical protein
MAMGKRKRDRQPRMWVTTTDLPTAASHPFYRRLNELLRQYGFDDFAEAQCATFYVETMGRFGLPPGINFRLLMIGYFEGINSERGIAWRAADSLALRDFLGVGLGEAPPDHSTISRTRQLFDLETHRAILTSLASDWTAYARKRHLYLPRAASGSSSRTCAALPAAYAILTLIGSSSMGEVYRARDTTLDRTVAIKILPESLAADVQPCEVRPSRMAWCR